MSTAQDCSQIIREMNDQDIETITKIDKECFPADPWSISMIMESKKNHHCFVITDQDHLTGYIFYSRILDEAEILHIAVRQSMQQKGIGSQLIQFVIDKQDSEGIKHWFLEVRESNQAAIGLYTKMGFNCVGRRKGYYATLGKAREDALIMHRGINC